VVHLLQLLVKLLLNLDQEVQDNSKLVGSLLIGGLWLLLLAQIFPAPLGSWQYAFVLGGWILAGMATFLFVRRKIWRWRVLSRARGRGSLFRT
jgi:hypothetical protein